MPTVVQSLHLGSKIKQHAFQEQNKQINIKYEEKVIAFDPVRLPF